jgi:hypothetical protein
MGNSGKPLTPRQTAEAKFAASERHDAQFFKERKQREAANIAQTLKLKALRLAKEAEERATKAAAKAEQKPAGKGRKPPAAS